MSATRMIIFISVVTAILSALTLLLGSRIIVRLNVAGPYKWVVWLALAMFVMLQLIGPILYRHGADPQRSFIVQWLTYTTLGLFSAMIILTLVADLGIWALNKLTSLSVDTERRLFFGVGGLALASVVAGAIQALKGPQIFQVKVPVKNLPPEFEGFRIAQISDLHVGPLIDKVYAQKVVDLTHSLEPQVIAITGDLIDGTVDQLKTHVAPLAQLKAPEGVYYCTGNHEYYWDAQSWIREVQQSLGGRMLINEHVVIQRGQASLVIGGVPDLSAQRMVEGHECSPTKAFEGAPQGATRILLAHQPDTYKRLSSTSVDLMLTGHTHGGQYYPWKWIVALAQKYYIGLNRHENTWIYVNRGTGYWGPPHRFGVPSEITLIELTRESPNV